MVKSAVIKEGILMKRSIKPLLFFVILFMAAVCFDYRDPSCGCIESSGIQNVGGRALPGKRINIVMLGIESNARADTIMFITYERMRGKLDIVSIPRDTYFYEKGCERGDQRKINAVYGRKNEKGCVDAVCKVLSGVSADYYISIDYEGVEEIIDTVDGVELYVPLDMEVGGIVISKGKQILKGKEALQYLRYRKGYPDGDIGRIKAQQKLIMSAFGKINQLDAVKIIGKSLSSIRTNLPAGYLVEYAREFNNNKKKDISLYILPGTAMYKHIGGTNWSYYFHNSQKTIELMNSIFGIESLEEKKRKHCETK